MKWLADECIAATVVRSMRSAGLDVSHVSEDAASATDIAVLERAIREQRILLTEDKDFGDLIFRRRISGAIGVVLLRIPEDRSEIVWSRIKAAIDRFEFELFGRFLVIEVDRFRTKLIPTAV